MNTKSYLQRHARRLDLRLYEHLFEGADAQPVVDELAKYQNPDGGFGNALEADVRMPDSSPLATTIAFQYLAQINKQPEDMIDRAIKYLVNSYDESKQCWVNITPKAEQFPRAPWWSTYEEVAKWSGWGNPSAEILGYFLQNASKVDPVFLSKLSDRAVSRLSEIEEPEQHEVICYTRLYERAGKDLKTKMHDKIAAHIKQLAKTDPKEWEGYAATPLTFVASPNSPFANLFDAAVLNQNAKFVRSQMVEGNHWEPTWSWGQFEDEWAKAKVELCGKITVENAWMLKQLNL